jgi:hypothetical protein
VVNVASCKTTDVLVGLFGHLNAALVFALSVRFRETRYVGGMHVVLHEGIDLLEEIEIAFKAALEGLI